MITSQSVADPASALFGKTRRAVLSLLYGHPDEAFYLRQIARTTGIGLGPVQRELKRLTEAGIVRRTVEGRQVYYQSNAKSPLYEELKGVAAKSRMPPVGRAGKEAISVPKRKLAAFCRRHHIRKLSLFGSVLREDFRPDSDVDVLVEFEPGKTPGFFKIADMETELSGLFGGREVDLRTPKDLNPYFRPEVVREAKPLYVAG